MNRETATKLSDSDFWQICHQLHPTTNYTFPAPPKLGVANGNHDFLPSPNNKNSNNNIQSESEEVSSSSDESLQNLFAKKSRAHRKLLTSHASSVNTQKIYDTIDFFTNENNKQKSLETSETSDESICTKIQTTSDMDSDENDSIANNADDLLMRLAGNVHQLKRNVNQMSELNGVCSKNGSINALDAGDLIDFSDDWMHQSENNDNISSHRDKSLKKVMKTRATMATMHACVQAEDTGSPNDIIANERFPYVTYEQRKNVKYDETGKVVNANYANGIECDYGIDGVGKMPMNGGNAYNRCIEIQVNCCTEWPNRSDDENRAINLPSPLTSSESTTSCCSSTTTTSDNSIFNMRSTMCSMVDTNDTLTCTNENSHTLNTEHNRPYEFEQCAYQKPNDDFVKTITKIANNTLNTTDPSNVNEDNWKSAGPIHTFVHSKHTTSDVNIEVDSSIRPVPLDSIRYLQQDLGKTNEGATLISAQNNNTNTNTNTNTNGYGCGCDSAEPMPLAKISSFIQPSPLNTITTADSFRLRAEWDADKNNNPLDYKDKRTKAQHPLRIENDDFDVVTDKTNKIETNLQCSNQVQNNSISECSVPIFVKQPPYSRQRKSDSEEFFVENVSFSCAASTPFAVNSIDAADIRNEDGDGEVLDLKTKTSSRRKTKKSIRCKLKYNNSKWFSERNKFNGKIQCQSRKFQIPEKYSCERNFYKRPNDLQCKLELNSNKRKSNRIGKHLKCNCKWKCCRGHLSDYDLCIRTLFVTSISNANGRKYRRKLHALDNFGKASAVNGTKSLVVKKQTTTSKKKTTNRQSSASFTSKWSSNTKSCESLPYKKFYAIETISLNAIECADTQLSKKFNRNNGTTPLDNNHQGIDYISNESHLITENCEASNDCDLSEAYDEIKSLKTSQPNEKKIKQVLDAVKYCSSQSVCGGGGGDLILNNKNDINNSSNYVVRPTTGLNSLKNSFKLSESCESIFTLKPKPISYSSSLLSLNGDPFEASNRLRRLEERFKDFASASLGKKGRCLSTNLLLSSPVSAQPHHHHHTVDVQQQQQQQQQQEKPNSHSKGHSNVTENKQEQQQHQHPLETNASFENLTPSKWLDSPQVDSFNESNCELNESVIFNEVLENCENGNVFVSSNSNDGNNNHIESKANNVNIEPSDKPIDVEYHICCSHIIKKRFSDRIQNSEQIKKLKSPIGKHESTLLLFKSSDADDVDVESVEKFDFKPELGTPIDADSSIKKLKYLDETASSTTTYHSCNGSLKSDLSDSKSGRDRKYDKDEHSNTIESSTNNDDSSHVINDNEKSINIRGHTQFDDNNKNSLKQQIHIVNDTNQESDEQVNGVRDFSANVESTKQQQLNDITNRLINCTPVSISTESEEICSLFPENCYNSIASPFIYHDEDSKTKCVFDVRQLNDNNHLPPYFDERIYECYDELEDDLDDNESPVYGSHLNQLQDIEHCKAHNNDSIKSLRLELPSKNYCQCTIESIVPIYPEAYQASNSKFHSEIISKSTGTAATATAIMRDMTSSGTLRGLLKKPNRPPPVQKNRVIFDETRNEFFDADYIILVRDECPYDEEDEEPCTCGEHELVRLCCDEGCQCAAYSDDGRTPQSPKFAPPMEFVDQAALSPPDGYKDGLQALGGVLGSHIFGAQHYQQLQVIQQLQAQRAAMLAAQRTNNNTNQKSSSKNHAQAAAKSASPPAPLPPSQTVCTECAECTECAAKQEHDEALPPHMALLSIQATSPERRFTQKEIIAGEERPKYLLIKHQEQATAAGTNASSTTSVDKSRSSKNPLSRRYVVETITMTTVTERRVVHEETNATKSIIIIFASTAIARTPATAAVPTSQPTNKTASADPPKVTITNTNDNENRSTYLNSDISLKPTSISAQITGILKGGKLWKNDLVQSDENTSSATSDDETFKRSVRFIDGGNPKAVENSEERREESQDSCDGESNAENEQSVNETDDTESLRKSTLFHNALMKPNSAVRQLFPSAGGSNPPQTTVLTHEALKAFDESKRSQLKSTVIQHSDSDSDTIRRTIERNTLRRSLIKYEPKKKPQKPETSLEERIRQLTCDIDELQESNQTLDRRDSPTGEENPQSQNTKYVPDKSFSPSSTASSSSNSSISAYKKITDIFHKEKRQERIPEADENPIVIIPQCQQDCRCPSAPDLGVGHLPTAHNNQLQSVRSSDARRQFLNSIAPLTACVAGQRDDMSFYSLGAGDRNSTGSSRCSEYSLGDIEAILRSEDAKKVAPDVIAGTPGQEHNDELAVFAQQEATRTERLKKRYSTEASSTATTSVPNSNAGSDDDEQNDYGFNHRPSVRGIKPRNNEEMLEEMQSQLSGSSVSKPPPLLPRNSGQSNTLPKASTHSLQSKVMAPIQQIQQQQQQAQSQQQIHQSIVHQQNISTWNAYYQEQAQRNSLPANAPPVYFQHPIQARHSYHQEESTIYQNCQAVAMEQQNHYGQTMVARSPTRRPESPPPLRNYHQTMVLIPYNTESYAQFTTADQIAAQQFQHQNILEYQQVTQQTIRVPIGYPLPGMQLHVVSQNQNQPYAQYATAARHQTQMNANRPGYGYIQEASVQHAQQAIKYSERGAPEGAASVTQSDCTNSMMSNPNLQQIGGQMLSSTANNTQTSNTSTTAQQGAVFYAMNV